MLCLPLGVEAMRHKKSLLEARMGSAASQMAWAFSWKANSSRMRSPEKPRAVRGLAARILMRPGRGCEWRVGSWEFLGTGLAELAAPRVILVSELKDSNLASRERSSCW